MTALLQSLSLQSLPQIVVERMLNGALESVVLAVLAWVLLKAIGRRSSSTRFAVWFVVLLAVVALPWMESSRWGRPVISAGSSKSAILIPSSWAFGLFCLWALVALVSLARVALGLWQIRRLRVGCARFDAAKFDPEFLEALQESCKRPISICVSPSTRVPMATGFFAPMIIFPAWALDELSKDELRVILLHEAAHLRRWDDWTNLAQKVLRAVFFFHPVVWWIEGKLALEREMACDDLVVEATSSPRAYAECLVALAEKSLGRRSYALAQAAVSRVRPTALRIRQILDGKRSGATAVWKPAVAFAAMAAMACLFFVSETPKLIGFSSPAGQPRSMPLAAQATPVSVPSNFLVKRAALVLPSSRPKSTKRPAPAPLPAGAANKVEVAANPFRNPSPLSGVSDQSGAASATLDLTGASYRSVAFTASETVFVVMQEQQFTAAGDKVLRFNVYRLTVFYPEFYPSNPQKTLSKSI